ncbi:MAG TPA: hypothetical protein VMW83_07625 [Spirochaetia bacterium]|nr:hypothetical protein [Spirochaetia bacterium]
MKIGIKQGIIIGALVLVGGGLLLQGAWADTSPQAVPLTSPPAQTLTVNPPTGTGDAVVNPQTYQDNSSSQVAPQGTEGYGGYGGYGGMMGGYGGNGGGGYGGMMGGYGGYGGSGYGGGMM